jgi:hypothetical protein
VTRLVHVFGVVWLATYAVMAVLMPVDPVYEVVSLLLVAGVARLWWTLRKKVDW